MKKIGVISDIHELNWIFAMSIHNDMTPLDYLIKKIIFKHSHPSQYDIMIIAGDISESPFRIIRFLDRFQELTKIKNIIFVPGNHEHYSTPKVNKEQGKIVQYKTNKEVLNDKTSLIRDRDIEEKFYPYENKPIEKVNYLIDYINAYIPNVFATNDGKTFEVEGIKMAGTCAWYDGRYSYKKYTRTYGEINFNSTIFQNQLKKIYSKDLDSQFVSAEPFELWYDYYKPIVENIEKNLDIVITHINPMIEDNGIHSQYHNNDMNSFFTFDGLEYIYDKKPLVWIHGHSHDTKEWEVADTLVLRNPLGNPKDNTDFFIKEILL